MNCETNRRNCREAQKAKYMHINKMRNNIKELLRSKQIASAGR